MKQSIIHVLSCSLLTVAGFASARGEARLFDDARTSDRSGSKLILSRPHPLEKAEKREKEEKGKSVKPGRGRDGHRAGGKGGDRLKAFREADANEDGMLSFEEFSTLGRVSKMETEKRRKLFDFLDKDKDGHVQMREIRPREPGWVVSTRRAFRKLDLNKDGTLSFDEFRKLDEFVGQKEEHVAKLFAKMDRNRNEKLERSELKPRGGGRPRPRLDFQKYDKDSSGGLNLAEYSSIPWMNKWPKERVKKLFQRIDRDNDGEISPSEIKSARRFHRPDPRKGAKKPRRGDKSRGKGEKSPLRPRG